MLLEIELESLSIGIIYHATMDVLGGGKNNGHRGSVLPHTTQMKGLFRMGELKFDAIDK